MIVTYPAIIHEEEKSFWAEFPDLPGCQTWGDSLNEVLSQAQEALSEYLITLWEMGKDAPKPTEFKDVKAEDGFINLITINITRFQNANKSVKKTLTIPYWLNERAVNDGINFSSVLQEALIEKLHIS